jgi:hypothetical protein
VGKQKEDQRIGSSDQRGDSVALHWHEIAHWQTYMSSNSMTIFTDGKVSSHRHHIHIDTVVLGGVSVWVCVTCDFVDTRKSQLTKILL